MIRFQCPHCRGIVAADSWEPGADTVCAYCSKEVPMPMNRLEPGAVMGDFLLVRKLGAGGMGIVFLAHQLSLDRPAAIKILNPEFSSEAESVKAFITEARSAAKLNHPNIVQAYAVGEDEGLFYFAMEFINGQTMKEVLAEKKKIEPRVAADIIMQVAEALDCAWREQKLIHHDIKPDNIMQCANERVKLADLGLAQVFGEDADDDSDEVIGTPQYISPEQLTGVVTDTRSDIYSLGATFYHLVTGQFPYNGENTEEIAKQHVFGTLNPPRNVNPMLPQVLNDIIVKMMAKDPNGRFQDCRELVKALKNYLEKGESSGGLSGGLMGGGSSGHGSKLGGGSAKPTLTLNSGMSGGGGGVQPKLSAPASPLKLSIKGAHKEEPKVEEKEAVPAEAPAFEAAPQEAVGGGESAPEAAPAAAPKITLNFGNKQADPTDDKAVEQETPPAADEVPETADVETVADEKAENSDSENSAENASAEEVENSEESAENSDGENSDADDSESAEKSRKGGKGLLIAVIAIVLLALAGGGAYYWFVMRPQAAKAAEQPVKKEMSLSEQLAAARKKVKVNTITDAPVSSEPSTAAASVSSGPALSAFMKRAKQLEELSLNNKNSFLSQWPSAARSLKPQNAVEKSFYDSLAAAYTDIEERDRIAPEREKLLAAYNSAVAAKTQRDLAAERIAAEKEVIKNADATREDYDADLQRKMSLLDHAMISAARNNRLRGVFQKAVELAKAEPKRVADREGFAESAQKLADYAARVELVAEQGRNFTDLIRKNSYKNQKISNLPILRDKMDKWIAEQDILVKDKKNKYSFAIDWDSLTVVNANINNMRLTVKLLVTREPKTLPKPKKPAKGKKAKAPAPVKPVPVLVTVNICMAKNNGTMAMAKNKVFNAKNVVFKDITLEEMSGWVKAVEALTGKNDQYFYYMLYNGNLKNRLSVIAPDDFWKKRVDRVARGYFKRCIQLANDAQLAILKKQYGSWLSFQRALEDVGAKK